MKLYYLFCNGSRGDCEPAVSLAQYMIVKGNRVRIYSNQKNKKFLEKSEIDHNIILKNYIFRQPEEVTSLEYYDEFKNSIIYHIDLINSIDEKPDVEVAQNLVDLINMMAEADDEVTEEEAMAVGEFTGMIAHYVSQEEGGSIDAFEVVIVPQNEKQSDAVKDIIPNISSVKKQGGEIFIVGTFYSEDYANAVCAKYISLGLFTIAV